MIVKNFSWLDPESSGFKPVGERSSQTMIVSSKRRGLSSLAGSYCKYRKCIRYSRYSVHPAGVDADPITSCGAHVAEAIRDIWTTHRVAAVIQEVPGNWTDTHK